MTQRTRKNKQVTPDLGNVGAQDIPVTQTVVRRRPQGDKTKAQPVTVQPEPATTPVKQTAKSIRALITNELKAGTDVKIIKELLIAQFPQSAAAAKSAKHIAFYKSVLKAAGELPVKVASVE